MSVATGSVSLEAGRDAGPRVVVASSGLGHVARGVEAWADDLARALDARGVNVTLCKGAGVAARPYERVIPCWRRDTPRAQRAARLLPRWLAWRLGVHSAYGVEQASFAWGLLRHLREERVDILHVQDPLVALIAEYARRVGWVRTRTILGHGTEEPPEFLRRLTYVQHLAPAHAEAARRAGADGSGWCTIPNFVDTDRFRPGRDGALRRELGIPGDALVVLSVAAIKKTHKRVDHLVREVAALRASEPDLPVYLVVAGGAEAETAEVIAAGQQLLGDRVRFLVRFPRERMSELYRIADVFVLTSLREMMPLAVLEAAASGLACVVNDDPALRWMAGPGGQIVAMGEHGALARALAGLLNDAAARDALGVAARDHCVREFGQDAVVGRIIEEYGRISGRPVAVPPAKTATVSVVIPTFNCGRWVVEAVESVLSQSHPACEVIVIDDGSTDDTEARLRPCLSRITYRRQPNAGVAAARNHGLRLATGDFVAFLDADDAWDRMKLERQLAAIRRHPEVGLLGTRTYDLGVLPSACEDLGGLSHVRREELLVKNYLTTSSVIMRREVIERVGVFDTALQGPEDHEYWIRASAVAGVAILEVPLTAYRQVPGSLSRRAASMEAGMHRILESLDKTRAWGGRWLLRRRAYGYAALAGSFLHADEGNVAVALRRVVQSLAWYPLPFGRREVRGSLVRLRRVGVLLRRVLMDRLRATTRRGELGTAHAIGGEPATVRAKPSARSRQCA